MAREKTTIDIDLDTAVTSQRKKTGMHGTQHNKTGRGAISKLKSIDQLTAGAKELLISTDECSLWSYNDRIYKGLNMENCKTLMDDIQKNTQLQPVVARHNPSGNKKYEIIIGTRRFWACSHLPAGTIKIALIEADDKHAYRLMRSENAERDDTTVYEKAINAKRVIAEIYQSSQKSYCLENDIPEQTLSNWMAIADMETEIQTVIPNMFEISVKQAVKLRMVMNKRAKSKKAVLEKARDLKGTDITTALIMKALIAAGDAATKPGTIGPTLKTYAIAGDKSGVTIKQATSGAITVKISKTASTDKAGVLKALTQHLA